MDYNLPERPGEACWLATTLSDPGRFPAQELAALYHERWEIKNVCDEAKTHRWDPGPRCGARPRSWSSKKSTG